MFDMPLDVILKALFGDDWRRRAAAALGCHRRTLQRWVSGKTRVSRRGRVLLERRALAVSAEIERWRREQHERIDKAARERKEAASGVPTQLRLMAIRDERDPPRVGRPPKRPAGPRPLRAARVIIPTVPYGPLRPLRPRLEAAGADSKHGAS